MTSKVHNWAVVVVLVSCFLWHSFGDPRTNVVGQSCNTSTAVSGGDLANNFVPAMDNLSSLVNQKGFGTVEVGKGPDAVYGLGQCLKDLNLIDCKLCFSEIRSLLPKCYPNIGGRLFLDGCFGRYENFSFFDQTLDSKDKNVCSFSKNSTQPDKFKEAILEVTRNVSAEAQTNEGFAVGSVSGPNTTIYALAQCWQNLEKLRCGSCLDAAAASIVSCSPGTEGRALFAGCYMRYSTGLFWNLNQTSSNSSGKGQTFWIILGVSLCIFVPVVVILIWKKCVLFGKPKSESLIDLYGSGLAAAISQSNLNFRYEDLKNATKNFDLSNKLGQGSYGIVYKAVLHDGREVAVKRLYLNPKQWIDQFFNEVNLINQLRHKNLAKLLGCSIDGPESLLVYEYCCNRSLDMFLFDNTNHDKHLDWQKRFDIIQGVAEGLFYLHEESEARIVHRDVKASNVLLDEKFKPKITDFGLARSFSEDQTHLSTGLAGTLGYMAPEYVVHGHLTEKADVYSFGVLVSEVVSGRKCSSRIGPKTGNFLLAEIWNHYKAKTVDQIIDERIYDERMKDEILHVMHIGLLCTQGTPSSRPTMAKVVELLRSSGDSSMLIIPNDPPFVDVFATENMDEGEVSNLLSTSPGSSEYGIRGR